jgi:hypothetical protein
MPALDEPAKRLEKLKSPVRLSGAFSPGFQADYLILPKKSVFCTKNRLEGLLVQASAFVCNRALSVQSPQLHSFGFAPEVGKRGGL